MSFWVTLVDSCSVPRRRGARHCCVSCTDLKIGLSNTNNTHNHRIFPLARNTNFDFVKLEVLIGGLVANVLGLAAATSAMSSEDGVDGEAATIAGRGQALHGAVGGDVGGGWTD